MRYYSAWREFINDPNEIEKLAFSEEDEFDRNAVKEDIEESGSESDDKHKKLSKGRKREP